MTRSEQLRRADQPIGTVQVVIASDAVRVVLAGEIDVDLDDLLDEAARAVGERPLPVLVDATRVTFMDSAGVRFIARFYGHGRLTVSASPTVQFLFEVLGMDDVLTRPTTALEPPTAHGRAPASTDAADRPSHGCSRS